MPTTRMGSKRLLRDLNQNIVFNLITRHGTISRTELAKLSKLPAATITRIVSNFLESGLISEVAADASSGGRRPILLSINPSAGYVAGVKLREDSMTVVICDLSCTPLFTCEQQITPGMTPEQIIDVIAEAVERSWRAAGIVKQQVLGVGVGLSGLIDSVHGTCRYSAILGWRDIELGSALMHKLHITVRVDNDVNTLAVAERYFGAGRDAANFLMVTLGRGNGIGIVVGGEIYRGSYGAAGEFGHITIDTAEDAPLCTCGKRGCLEAIASDFAIQRRASEAYPERYAGATITALIERAQQGDQFLIDVFAHAGEALGIAIANMINLFDPTCVLIGGEGLRAGNLMLDAMHAAIPRHVFGPTTAESVKLIFCPTDETYWARGAASLILREMLQPPIYEKEEVLPINTLLFQGDASRP